MCQDKKVLTSLFILDRSLSKNSHDFGKSTITNPDLASVQDEVLSVRGQNSTSPWKQRIY